MPTKEDKGPWGKGVRQIMTIAEERGGGSRNAQIWLTWYVNTEPPTPSLLQLILSNCSRCFLWRDYFCKFFFQLNCHLQTHRKHIWTTNSAIACFFDCSEGPNILINFICDIVFHSDLSPISRLILFASTVLEIWTCICPTYVQYGTQ